ncbi:MAG TPA: SHOCT domain-containing protein, partial [Micromonospora sp.]
IGVAVLVKALAQDAMPPDARLGAALVGVVFIPMGLVLGGIGLLQLRRRRAIPRPRKRGPRPDSGTPLRQLHRLRSSGLLTRAEFDALKTEPPADRLALVRQLADLRASGVLTPDEFEAKKRDVLAG